MLTLLLALACAAPVQDDSGEPRAREAARLRVETDAVWPTGIPGCPYPLRIRIENLGPGRDVECVVENEGWNSGEAWTARRRFRLAEKENVQGSLLVPSHGDYARMKVLVDGKEVPDFSDSFSGRGGDRKRHLVIDRRKTFSEADLQNSFPSSSGSGDCLLLAPDRMTDAWQAYVGPAEVWARAADWKLLPLPARQAILRAVKSGQTLVLYETGTGRNELDSLLFEGSRPGWAKADSLGFHFGFGKIIAVSGPIIGSPNLPEQYKVASKGPFEPIATSLSIPMRGVGQVPYVSFFWIVFLFAILMGPVNLLFVRKLGKRVFFVITTPLIALTAVGTLFGYSMAKDGFGLKASASSVTLLSSEDKEAVVISTTNFFSGLSSGTWKYDPGTLCMNLRSYSMAYDDYSRYSRHRQSMRLNTLDWTRGQEIGGAWVPARELTRLGLVQVIPHRSRLAVEKTTDGKLRVLNGLGTDVLAGALSWEGQEYALPAIRDGASAEVAPADGAVARLRLTNAEAMIVTDPAFYHLVPGEFIAVTAANPAIDRGGKTLEEIGNRHLVKGTLTEPR